MAKAHSTSGTGINKTPKTERYYTVGYVPQEVSATHRPLSILKAAGLKRWVSSLDNRYLSPSNMDDSLFSRR